MQARKLDRSEWQAYFDRISKQIGGRRVEIEVASLDIGDQIGVEWVPLKGVTYDPASNSITFSKAPPDGAVIEIRYAVGC